MQRAAARCEPFCASASCDELNGNVEYECGACPLDHACRPGALGFGAGKMAASVATHGLTKLVGEETWDTDDHYERGLLAWRHADMDDPGLQRVHCTEGSRVAGRDPQPPPACERMEHRLLDRSTLLARRAPLIITGLTEGWRAHERWGRAALLEAYASHYFSLSPEANVTIERLLSEKRYHLAHAEHDGCYHASHGPYSPFLLSSVAADYTYPPLLQHPTILQMAIGERGGDVGVLGVPPESHHSSWLAQIKGTKRWAFHPPSPRKPCAAFARGGTESCALGRWSEETLVCEQQPGDVIWTPEGWWHETCTLDSYSAALGAVTALTPTGDRPPRPCAAHEYTTRDLPFCRTNRCPGLGGRD